jgi:hypothetical protein
VLTPHGRVPLRVTVAPQPVARARNRVTVLRHAGHLSLRSPPGFASLAHDTYAQTPGATKEERPGIVASNTYAARTPSK